MTSALGFIKGTPLRTGRGDLGIDSSDAFFRIPLIVLVEGAEEKRFPLGVFWYWSTEFYTLWAGSSYLRLACDQAVQTADGWKLPGELREGDKLDGFGRLTCVHRDRTLAPLCCLTFDEPVVIFARGAALRLDLSPN